jgi:hypothetical protein
MRAVPVRLRQTLLSTNMRMSASVLSTTTSGMMSGRHQCSLLNRDAAFRGNKV